MKDQCYRYRNILSWDGQIFFCDCTCKVGGDDDEKKSCTDKDKNMVYEHALPNFMKLSLLLSNFLAEYMSFELSSFLRRYDIILSHAEE